MWVAKARYEDGSEIGQRFPYTEENEDDQQYKLECWLLERDKVCVWYSVDYEED